MSANLNLLLRATALLVLTTGAATAAPAEDTKRVTACTALNLCYCIDGSNRDPINANVTRLRQLIVEQRALGKAIGYVSIPLSTAGGSYFGVNQDVAKDVKGRIEKRLGQNSVWMLNPGAEGNLPPGTSGADYMLMWTRILEGRSGLGEDFDFVYFVGPSDYATSFKLTGNADLETIDARFEERRASDQKFDEAVKKNQVTKRTFRNYYGLRASVAFSYGSHDEWNIARLINERRRGSADFGIANQLGILFDGRAVNPSDFESADSAGDVGRCVN